MNLLERFNKYTPDAGESGLMSAAEVISLKADRERRLLEVRAAFPELVIKEVLYALEEKIMRAYDLQYMRIFPVYRPEQFREDYLPQIIAEAERAGAVARGFFGAVDYRLTEDTLELEIPFCDGGIGLIYAAGSHEIIAGIIKSEFGLDYCVSIINNQTALDFGERYKSELDEIDREIARANEMFGGDADLPDARSGGKSPKNTLAETRLPRVQTLGSGEISPEYYADNGASHVRLGNAVFDISEPELLCGSLFEIADVIPVRDITKPGRGVVLIGQAFDFTKKESKQNGRTNISFGLHDGDSSIYIRRYSKEPGGESEEDGYIDAIPDINNGDAVVVRGNIRREKFDDELALTCTDILKIKKVDRMDDYPGGAKRIELHLHTQMSSMDAVIPPAEAVRRAHRWGHAAVAITDHGSLQAFPEAMLEAEKLGMKVIYGVEAYFTDDTARALFGTHNGPLDGEAVVFDIETTGLSPANNRITEIGAVRLRGGEITERFGMLVNPGVEIPERIVNLTGITNEMVADAPAIEEVLPKFLAFAGDKLMIAHNAGFDAGFIRTSAAAMGYSFENPYLDTVALARYIDPDLKSHKLNSLAEHYGLGGFGHHRACEDAEMLARIFIVMIEKLHGEGIKDFEEMERAMGEKSDPLKQKTYHQILLVKNKTGLKNLYKIISDGYLKYYRRNPRLPKTLLDAHREGLLVGSACEAGELYSAMLGGKTAGEIEKIASYYDYLEIQPICNNRFLVSDGRVSGDDGLREFNRRIYELGKKLGKPVVATCDAHFLDREDEIYRRILLCGMKFSDGDREIGIYMRTTAEMLEEFAYLGEDAAYEVVVENPAKINEMIEQVRPIPPGSYPPELEGSEAELEALCWGRAHELYGRGGVLPETVEARLRRELDSIIKHNFSVLYIIAHKLVKYSEDEGYLVGSRGSVGSSFAAAMAGISEVNPLPPHYVCPACRYSQFGDLGVGSGFDLPPRDCPECGKPMLGDGHDIPFETFLGFYGDKSPDIDLNFSGNVQERVHKYTEKLFGSENVFRAGTISALASKTAYGFVAKYLEGKGVSINKAEVNRLVSRCVGVKRTTGQHPGGIIVVPRGMDIYDFTPVQRPADDANSNVITTHFPFSYLHDTILKLDELGHDIPTKYKMLEKYSGKRVLDVPMNDRRLYDLFTSTAPLGIGRDEIFCEVGTLGLPEVSTRFVQQVLAEAQPKNFSDLLQVSGLTHGTDVWLGNAQELIKEGVCGISQVIGTRDGIMLDLIRWNLDNSTAFKIMESVRKGKGLTDEWKEKMNACGVPRWYIDSCLKIKYMFPKAHAAAYVMAAVRLAWYKLNEPLAFYAALLTVAPGGFDAEIIMGGHTQVRRTIKDLEDRRGETTQKEEATLATLLLANECMARGIGFLPVDLRRSDMSAFVPEETPSGGMIRMPFSSLAGLGENAARNIAGLAAEGGITTVEELKIRAKLNKNVIEILRRCGVLDGIPETNQLTLF